MKVYLSVPQPSRGLQRIADALTRYYPGEITQQKESADAVVIFAIGRRDDVNRQILALGRDQKCGIIQLCLRATQKPLTQSWRAAWEYADVVWSYYDLNRMAEEDAADFQLENLYYAPLGADPAIFFPIETFAAPKRYKIVTSGESYLSESVRECWKAARNVNGAIAHLGPVPIEAIHQQDAAFTNKTDVEVADIYCRSEWVSGLRRTEGFELPAAEGALCGVRPVLFDRPDMRWWYDQLGVFIQEGTRDYVIQRLTELFSEPPAPMDRYKIELARHRFNWERIVKGFYERLL